MNKLAEVCIQRVYFRKDYQYFAEKSREIPSYLERLVVAMSSLCKEIKTCALKNEPSMEIWFLFEGFTEQNFSVRYKTLLKVSKVANLFVIQHEFCVENIDPNRMTPVLDGFGEEPYTEKQYRLEKAVADFLESRHLQKLPLSELEDVIPELDIPNESIFGKQMTLENALFRDLYEICKE